MFCNISYKKYSQDWTEEEKERQFKLIKRQIKTANSYKEVPALEVMFTFWDMYRVLKNFIEKKLGRINIDYFN